MRQVAKDPRSEAEYLELLSLRALFTEFVMNGLLSLTPSRDLLAVCFTLMLGRPKLAAYFAVVAENDKLLLTMGAWNDQGINP